MQFFWYGIFLPFCSFLWSFLPHKYPVPGTRVRVYSYTRWESSMGTIVGPEYDYVGPFEQKRGYPREGVYFNDDPHFAHNWVVRLDGDVGTLEQHCWENLEYISGYRIGIPRLVWLLSPSSRSSLWSDKKRIGGLPHPIEFYPEDWVEHNNEQGISREVTNFWFNLDGTLCYTVSETAEEWKLREAKAREEALVHNRAVVESMGPGIKYHQISGDSLRLMRRGNYHHLAHGTPEDLSFPHVTLEVDFWSRIGTWLNDEGEKNNRRENTLEEARQKLLLGEIDTVHTGRDLEYHPIRLPERFAQFRARSRNASLEYLASYAGKYPFDIFSQKELETFQRFEKM